MLPPPCPLQDKEPLKRQLQQLARQAQWLVLWLDCDREGENISFEVCVEGAGRGLGGKGNVTLML